MGLLMGLQGAAVGLAGGLGPFVGGVLEDGFESWNPVVVMSTAALVLAAILLTESTSN